jgi:hypothetical protein
MRGCPKTAGNSGNSEQRGLPNLIEDLEKLDSVILQFDPSHRVEAINWKAFRPLSDWSHRGEMTKAVLIDPAASGRAVSQP